MVDDGIETPNETAAGRYLVTVTNETNAAALVQFLHPSGNTTLDQIGADVVALKTAQAGTDAVAWLFDARLAGGVEVAAEQAEQAVVDLTPGAWFVADLLTSSPDTVAEIAVTGQMPTDLPRPKADATITMVSTDTGYGFTFDGQWRAGSQVIRVNNKTDQPHNIVLFSGGTPLTADAFEGLSSGQLNGGPFGIDAKLLGGAQAAQASGVLSAGETFWWLTDFPAGSYTLVCLVPDRDGSLHAQEGMLASIEVS